MTEDDILQHYNRSKTPRKKRINSRHSLRTLPAGHQHFSAITNLRNLQMAALNFKRRIRLGRHGNKVFQKITALAPI